MRGPRWGRGPLPMSAGGPVGTVAGPDLRRGFPPGPGRGSRLSLEKARTQRVAGGGPPPPLFYGPLVPTRSFWRLLSRIRSRGYFLRDSKTDLERIFRKKYAEKAFYERKSPNQGTYMGTVIAPPPGQCGTNAKTSERQQAGHKTGVQGACPRPSFSPFLGRNGDPRRAGGAPGALRPKGGFRATHPKGTYHRQRIVCPIHPTNCERYL